jgi:porin
MNVGPGQTGASYDLFAAELAYRLETDLGEGNYRVVVGKTSRSFPDPDFESRVGRDLLIFSVDQELWGNLGAFARIGWQGTDAAVDYKSVYSGGLSLGGGDWGRGADNLGLAYAHVGGGSNNIEATDVAEIYYRFVLNEHLALTGDLQYMTDRYKTGGGPEGWIFGLRATTEF